MLPINATELDLSRRSFDREVSEEGYKGDLRPQSAQYFRDTKVRTCSYIKQKPDGTYLAVPFYIKRSTKVCPSPSQYNKSWSAYVHKPRRTEHAGTMPEYKSLSIYRPNSARSRLLIEDFIPPYRNSSVIGFGDRSQADKNRWATTYTAAYQNKQPSYTSANPEIRAFKSRWDHRLRK